jgi:UPF0755 protein
MDFETGSRQEHNMSTGRKSVFRIVGLLALIVGLGCVWFMIDFQSFRRDPLPIPEAGVTLLVEPGSNLKRVARQLQGQGLLDKPLYLVMLGRYLGLDAHIKAGEFRLAAGLNPEQLLSELNRGQVIQHSLTLIEGETFRELIQRVAADEVLEQTLSDGDAETVMAALGYPGQHPEGRFLPETYHFPRGTTDIAFLQRAYQEMQAFLDASWAERDADLPLKSPYEALILASIVEKETAVGRERPEIAGVFIRRLRKGMKLQTDPTVIYGMGNNYDGDIRFRDLRTDTPYNTYTRFGLPPTPIAMPGKEAILAALHPADGKALYFVARGDGSHQFSDTLEKHNRAVDQYQRKH